METMKERAETLNSILSKLDLETLQVIYSDVINEINRQRSLKT